MVMRMVEFKDKNGQPLSLRTNLENVNIELTPAHELELAAWDSVKPDLGTMDQGISAFHAVVDPDALALSERFQPQDNDVSKETWLEKWDRTKPDLGTMTIPYIVDLEEPGV